MIAFQINRSNYKPTLHGEAKCLNCAPVEYLRSLYRPDRYQYRMTMEREKTGGEQWSTMDRDLTVIQGNRRDS